MAVSESKIAHLVGDAVHKFSMIEEGDRILVAFSGGKDSYVLLDMLLRLKRKSPVKFDVVVVTVDAGFGGNFTKAEAHMRSLGVEYHIEKANIYEAVKEVMGKQRKAGKYCFMCSRMRRGVLYAMCDRLKCTKLALGHNLDDAIETFMLNSFYASKPDIMEPKYIADDGKNIVIRPLIHVPEDEVLEYSKMKGFKIVKQKCLLKPKDSKRLMLKKMIGKLAKENRYFYSSMINVLDSFSKKA